MAGVQGKVEELFAESGEEEESSTEPHEALQWQEVVVEVMQLEARRRPAVVAMLVPGKPKEAAELVKVEMPRERGKVVVVAVGKEMGKVVVEMSKQFEQGAVGVKKT
jgi:hypothetical protein